MTRRVTIQDVEDALNEGIRRINEWNTINKKQRLKESEIAAGNYILGRVAQVAFDRLHEIVNKPTKRSKKPLRSAKKKATKSASVAGVK